tara:strand:- start:133 stop:2043 length:1911 start_codon:yes stop_codon:yes gene_type:complete
MAFTPRTAEEILNDFINYLVLNTSLTDFNVGSVIRTFAEAAALEDADQYAQMLQILQSFFLDGSFGKALEERAAEYDEVKSSASPSTGSVQFLDTQLDRSFLTQDANSGDATCTVLDAAVFPTVPFTVRLGEGTGSTEDIAVSAVNLTTNVLTFLVPNVLISDHAAAGTSVDEIDNLASLVCLVSGDPNRTISSGITLRSRGSNLNISVEVYTSELGIHTNGNFASDPINVITKQVGARSVIPSKRLTSIVGNPPYSGASVTNIAAISGGTDADTDAILRQRIRDKIASLSAATLAALTKALLDVSDAANAQKISKLNIFEDFANDTVFAYINPGLGAFAATIDQGITDTLSVVMGIGATNLTVNNGSDFPVASLDNAQFLILDTDNADGLLQTLQVQEVVGNLVAVLFTLQGGPAGIGTQVAIAEVVSASVEFNQKYFFLNNTPVVRESDAIYVVSNLPINTSTTTRQIRGQDYIINEAMGQIEFLDAASSNDGASHLPPVASMVLVVYDSYSGLVRTAQQTIDGDLTSPLITPGVRSAGVKVLVEPAARELVDFILNITVDVSVSTFGTAQFLTEQAVIAYVASLDVGKDIILAEIFDSVMEIPGVTNLKVLGPADDVPILFDHFADVGSLVVS